MFPMVVQSSLEKYGFLLKNNRPSPFKLNSRGMDFWSRGLRVWWVKTVGPKQRLYQTRHSGRLGVGGHFFFFKWELQ